MDQISVESSDSLLEHTRYLLINRPRLLTLAKISEDTGIAVSWLSLLVANNYGENGPGVNPLQKLYEYLSGKKLLESGRKIVSNAG